MKRARLEVGLRLRRRADGARARIVTVGTATPSRAHPGPFGVRLYTLELEDAAERARTGDPSGTAGWVRTYWIDDPEGDSPT